MDLTISIVSWNVEKLLEACLKSIFENTKNLSFEVFVSDNASSDNTAQMVRKDFPQVSLIENKENLGFPKANNQIIKQAKGKYVILLNPDTIVKKGSLETLVKFMETHPFAGAVGPKLEYPEGGLQLSCRSFPTLETELYRTLFLDHIFPKSRIFGKYMMSFWKHDDIREVDQLMGAALLVRKKTINDIGSMDERIFYLYDEVDWCKRIKDKGWKIYFDPEATIYHHKSKSFVQLRSPKKAMKASKIWRTSRNYYFRKHHGKTASLLVGAFDYLHIAAAIAYLYIISRGLISFLGWFVKIK